jgi:hypothetical protein
MVQYCTLNGLNVGIDMHGAAGCSMVQYCTLNGLNMGMDVHGAAGWTASERTDGRGLTFVTYST